MAQIKILHDTPLNREGDILSVDVFRTVFSYLHALKLPDDDLITFLKKEREHYLKGKVIDTAHTGYWFEVIEEPKFKIGDWVWNEKLQKAFNVIDFNIDTIMKPNECSLKATNTNPNTYKRFATPDEIYYYSLYPFCDNTVLIGQSECYYFNYIWKPIINIYWNVNKYIHVLKELRSIEVLDSKNEKEFGFPTTLNGLKVGCKYIPHKDVMQIAKILNLIR